MRMTIIPSDKVIGVDGAFLQVDFPFQENIHAIQIYDAHAEIEYNNGTQNEIIGTAQLSVLINQYLPVYEAAKERQQRILNPPAPHMTWDNHLEQWVDMRTLADALALRLADLARIRWEKETGGITIDGAAIATDRESQSLITGAWVRCQQHPDVLIDWKADSGWVKIDRATVEAIADAVGSHVQACFTCEKAHADALTVLDTIAAIDAYDIAAGWPA